MSTSSAAVPHISSLSYTPNTMHQSLQLQQVTSSTCVHVGASRSSIPDSVPNHDAQDQGDRQTRPDHGGSIAASTARFGVSDHVGIRGTQTHEDIHSTLAHEGAVHASLFGFAKQQTPPHVHGEGDAGDAQAEENWASSDWGMGDEGDADVKGHDSDCVNSGLRDASEVDVVVNAVRGGTTHVLPLFR
jgi:hypothetical protein